MRVVQTKNKMSMKLIVGREYWVNDSNHFCHSASPNRDLQWIQKSIKATYIGKITLKIGESRIIFFNEDLSLYLMYAPIEVETFCEEVVNTLDISLEEIAKRFGVDKVNIIKK